MGFQFEQHRLGLWDLSWDLKKTISGEMGLGPLPPPPSRPSIAIYGCRGACFSANGNVSDQTYNRFRYLRCFTTLTHLTLINFLI